MMAKRIAFLLACLVLTSARADEFFWINKVVNKWLPFSTLANWNKGTSATGTAVTRAPTTSDTIDYGIASGEYRHLLFDMGGKSVTVKGFTNLDRDWLPHYLGVSNGTLTVTDSFAPRAFVTTVAQGGRLVVKGASTDALWGGSGIICSYTVLSGGSLSMSGAYSIYGSFLTVEAGGSAEFAVSKLGWKGYSDYANAITNNGSLSIPNGIAVTTPPQSELETRHPSFSIVQESGTLTLGGNITRERKCDEGNCPVNFFVNGGTVVFACEPTFTDVNAVIGDSARATFSVEAGLTLDLSRFTGGEAAQLNKSGEGYVRPAASAAYSLFVNEGGFVTTSAEEPIPASVSIGDGATVCFGAPETVLKASMLPNYAACSYDIDPTAIAPGETVVKSADATLLKTVYGRFKSRASVSYVLDRNRIVLVSRGASAVVRWTGAAGDGKWMTPGNWEGGVVPGLFENGGYADDQVLFAESSGGAQMIDLTGLVAISNVFVSGPTTPVYTFGTSADQTLRFVHNGGLHVASDVINMPVLKATFGFKNPETGSVCTNVIENLSAKELVVGGLGNVVTSWADIRSCQVNLCGAGPIRFAGTTKGMGVLGLDVLHRLSAGGRFIVGADISLHQLRVDQGDTVAVRSIEILSGKTLTLAGGSGTLATISRPTRIYGAGTLKLTSAAVGEGFANGTVEGGAYNLKIESLLASECQTATTGFKSGLRYSASGTLELASSNNMIDGDIEAVVNGGRIKVASIGNANVKSALGYGANVRLANGAGLWYAGTGETAGRTIVLSNSHGRVYQGGSGKLTMSASPVTEVSSSLYLENLCASDNVFHDGVWSAPLKDNPKTLTVVKNGDGRWILSGANTHTGSTTVDTGVLRLTGNGTLATSSQVVLQNGGTLELDGTGAETLKKLVCNTGNHRLVLSGNATLTIASLSHNTTGTLSIETASDVNTVTVTGTKSATARYDWVTLNGKATAFDDSGKLISKLVTPTDTIAARGGVIPNGTTKTVSITTPGTSGNVTLAGGGSVSIKALSQEETTVPAQVQISSGSSLTSAGLYAAKEAKPLTIGMSPTAGSLSSAASEMILYPEGSNSTINVVAPWGVPTSTALRKYGLGTVRIASSGMSAWKGNIYLNEGTLALSNQTALVATLKEGFGTVAIEGTTTNTLTTAQSSFRGQFELRGGVTRPKLNTSFGSYSYYNEVIVRPGATLDMNSASDSSTLSYNGIGLRIAGDGADGKGAIIGPKASRSVVYDHLNLDGDASIGALSSSGWSYLHIRASSGNNAAPRVCDFGGHTLTHNALGIFSFENCKIVNPGPINLHGEASKAAQNGIILYSNVELGEPTDPPITIGDGSVIYLGVRFNPGSKPYMRKLVVEGTNTRLGTWAAGCDTNQNCWSGPIVLKNADSVLFLTASEGSCNIQIPLHGQITGAGGILAGDNRGRYFLTHPNNTYSGTTVLNGQTGGSLQLSYPHSLPNPAKTTINGGRATVYTDGDAGTHWKRADILTFVNTAELKAKSSGYPLGVVAVDARGCPGEVYRLTLADSDLTNANAGLGVDGGRLEIDGAISKLPNLAAHLGTLAIVGNRTRTLALTASVVATSDGTNDMGVISFEGGSKTFNAGPLRVGSTDWVNGNTGKIAVKDASLIATSLDETASGATLDIGYNDAAGILEINEGANVSNGLRLATASTGGSRGALHMLGGRAVFWGNQSFGIQCAGSQFGYGYIGVEGGELILSGLCQMSAVNQSATDSESMLYQSGGTVRYDHRNLDASSGDLGWRIGGTKNSEIRFYRTGGTMYVDRTLQLGYPENASYTDGFLQFTQGVGAGLVEIEKNFVMAGANKATAILNLNGGVLKAKKFFKLGGKTGNKAYVNFNGGTVIAKAAHPIFGTVSDETSTGIDRATVFAGGAHIGVAAGVTATLGVVLHPPVGNGIVSIQAPDWETIVPTNLCGRMVGPPTVVITDSTGYGASAVVEFDRARLMPGKVVITSPGCNYTSPKVKFVYAKTSWNGTAFIGEAPVDGGLAVEGDGTILLDKANDYKGPTTVNSGTLKPTRADAIPADSPIVLNGGMFDMNGFDFPASRITMNAGGGLMNSAGSGVVPVQTSYVADMDDLRAGRSFNYKGNVSFAAGTTVTIVNASSDDFGASAPSSYTLFHVDGTLTGAGNISVVVEDLEPETSNWRVTSAGGDVKFRCSRGNFIIMY